MLDFVGALMNGMRSASCTVGCVTSWAAERQNVSTPTPSPASYACIDGRSAALSATAARWAREGVVALGGGGGGGGGRRCLCETSIHMRSTLLAAISICTCDLSKSVKGEES